MKAIKCKVKFQKMCSLTPCSRGSNYTLSVIICPRGLSCTPPVAMAVARPGPQAATTVATNCPPRRPTAEEACRAAAVRPIAAPRDAADASMVASMATARARCRADGGSRSGGACSPPWRGRARAAARSSRGVPQASLEGGSPSRLEAPRQGDPPQPDVSGIGPVTDGGGSLAHPAGPTPTPPTPPRSVAERATGERRRPGVGGHHGGQEHASVPWPSSCQES